MYGSNFWIVTFNPLDCKSFAKEADTIPLPREEVTPPVTKIYLVDDNGSPYVDFDTGIKVNIKFRSDEVNKN